MPWIGLDLKGRCFGDLTALEKVGKNTYGWIWKCQCKCGNITEAVATKLRSGSKKSCGCHLHGERHYMWSGYKSIGGYFWRRVLERAKHRNLQVTMTVKDAWDLLEKQKWKCALTGVELTTARTSKGLLEKEQTASLDRIDSTKGYTLDNVQWVHKDINIMKMDMSENDLIYWARKITSYFRGREITEPSSERIRWSNRNEKKNTKTN